MDTPDGFAPCRVIASYDWAALLTLIHTEYAFMQGRVDPPTATDALTPEALADQAARGEIWVIEAAERPVACIFLTPKPPALFICKLAVASTHRGRGLARRLVAVAEDRAAARGLTHLALHNRVELTENHAAFTALGFAITGQTAHEGYERPTRVTMQRPVGLR